MRNCQNKPGNPAKRRGKAPHCTKPGPRLVTRSINPTTEQKSAPTKILNAIQFSLQRKSASKTTGVKLEKFRGIMILKVFHAACLRRKILNAIQFILHRNSAQAKPQRRSWKDSGNIFPFTPPLCGVAARRSTRRQVGPPRAYVAGSARSHRNPDGGSRRPLRHTRSWTSR